MSQLPLTKADGIKIIKKYHSFGHHWETENVGIFVGGASAYLVSKGTNSAALIPLPADKMLKVGKSPQQLQDLPDKGDIPWMRG